MQNHSLRINEIFYSLQGESRTVGLPTVFVRLTGCPLRCQYCDTEYAFHDGEQKTIDAIIAEVKDYKPRYVCVTGGEPLAQPNCLPLLKALCDQGFKVSLETSGAMAIEGVDSRVSRVLDLKTPGSGEVSKNLYANLAFLNPKDQIKFVICHREDYEWSRFKLSEFDLHEKVDEVLFSPSYDELEGKQLAEWIIEDKLLVRFQLQQHKLLWGDKPGH